MAGLEMMAMGAEAAHASAMADVDSRRQVVPILSTMDRAPTFGESLAAAIQPVVEPQRAAELAVAEFARGEEGEVHRTMLALSRADVSLRLFVSVRNKALEAFREVLHMGG